MLQKRLGRVVKQGTGRNHFAVQKRLRTDEAQ